MKIGMFAKKIGMTRLFRENGISNAVTVLEVQPSVILGVKTEAKDGYNAVQLAYENIKETKLNKSQRQVFKNRKISCKKHIYEIRTDDLDAVKVGDQIGIDNFQSEDFVDICGVSIGKGFQGVMKRHNFAGGRASHGDKTGRRPGSIGQCADPARVFKGIKGPGRMGGKQITEQNLKVYGVDYENNLLLIAGAVPGSKNSIVKVSLSLKKGRDSELKITKGAPEKEITNNEATSEVLDTVEQETVSNNEAENAVKE